MSKAPHRFPHDHNCGIDNTRISRVFERADYMDLELWGDITIFNKRLTDQDRFHLHLPNEQLTKFIRWLQEYRPDLMPKKETPVPKYRSIDDQ